MILLLYQTVHEKNDCAEKAKNLSSEIKRSGKIQILIQITRQECAERLSL